MTSMTLAQELTNAGAGEQVVALAVAVESASAEYEAAVKSAPRGLFARSKSEAERICAAVDALHRAEMALADAVGL